MTRPGAITDIARVQDPAVRRALQSLAEAVEFREGRRPSQNALDRFVTLRELRSQSTRDITEAVRRASSAAGGGVGSDGGDLDFTQPPQPSGATATGGVGQIILSWESPWDAYGNHSLTEVWRADVSDIGQATLVTRTGGRVWVDADVSEGATRYYWIRFVSLAGVEGPFSDVVSATSTRSAETVRDALTASVWQASTAYSVFAVVAPTTPHTINGVEARFQAQGAGTSGTSEPDWTTALAFGDSVTDNDITWQAIEVGKVPFITGDVGGVPTVFMHGAAMLDATIRDAAIEKLNATKLFATVGTIAEAIIGDADITNAMIANIIQSNNYSAGSTGWRVNKDGTAEFQNVIARGDIEATSIESNTALIDTANIFDLAVSTVKIKSQAVTFPQASYSTAEVIKNDLVWETIKSFTFNVSQSNNPVEVVGCASLTTGDSGTNSNPYIEVRLLIDGAIVFGPARAVTGSFYWDASANEGQWEQVEGSAVSTVKAMVSNLSAGNHSLSLQIWSSDFAPRASYRYVRALELKK